MRRSPRHQLHYLACIEIGDDKAPQSCMIWDISEGGARLTIPAKADLPNEFVLLLRRRCRVIRREPGQLGVQFLAGS